jgi:ribosomal protein S28E/S33
VNEYKPLEEGVVAPVEEVAKVVEEVEVKGSVTNMRVRVLRGETEIPRVARMCAAVFKEAGNMLLSLATS